MQRYRYRRIQIQMDFISVNLSSFVCCVVLFFLSFHVRDVLSAVWAIRSLLFPSFRSRTIIWYIFFQRCFVRCFLLCLFMITSMPESKITTHITLAQSGCSTSKAICAISWSKRNDFICNTHSLKNYTYWKFVFVFLFWLCEFIVAIALI